LAIGVNGYWLLAIGPWQEWRLARMAISEWPLAIGYWQEWLLARMAIGVNGDWRLARACRAGGF
jgi:hypothetical protein